MNIFESMGKVMDAVGAVAKDSINPQQGYKYRGIDAVMNALNPALTKYHVFVSPEVLDMKREERQSSRGGVLIHSIVTVKYTFYAEDASSISCITMGEGMDSGDKSLNKAMSAAYKYALFQVFCIPTEEMHDSNEDSPEPTPRAIVSPPQQKNSNKASKAENIKQELKRTNTSEPSLLRAYKVQKLEDLTEEQMEDAFKKLTTRATIKK